MRKSNNTPRFLFNYFFKDSSRILPVVLCAICGKKYVEISGVIPQINPSRISEEKQFLKKNLVGISAGFSERISQGIFEGTIGIISKGMSVGLLKKFLNDFLKFPKNIGFKKKLDDFLKSSTV